MYVTILIIVRFCEKKKKKYSCGHLNLPPCFGFLKI